MSELPAQYPNIDPEQQRPNEGSDLRTLADGLYGLVKHLTGPTSGEANAARQAISAFIRERPRPARNQRATWIASCLFSVAHALADYDDATSHADLLDLPSIDFTQRPSAQNDTFDPIGRDRAFIRKTPQDPQGHNNRLFALDNEVALEALEELRRERERDKQIRPGNKEKRRE